MLLMYVIFPAYRSIKQGELADKKNQFSVSTTEELITEGVLVAADFFVRVFRNSGFPSEIALI